MFMPNLRQPFRSSAWGFYPAFVLVFPMAALLVANLLRAPGSLTSSALDLYLVKLPPARMGGFSHE